MRWVVVKPPEIPQYFSVLKRHLRRAAGAGPPPKSGARVGSEHRSSESTFHTRRVAIPETSDIRSWRLPDAGPFWLLRTFYPCRCDGTEHPRLMLEAWRRVPPSRPRFRPEPGLFDGDAHQLVPRGGAQSPLAARGLSTRDYPPWPFTIAPSGICPCSTYRQSAMSSLRASATIPIRRSRRLPLPNCR